MLRRLYDATWGRAFAWGYDRFQQRAEDAGMRERRIAAAIHDGPWENVGTPAQLEALNARTG